MQRTSEQSNRPGNSRKKGTAHPGEVPSQIVITHGGTRYVNDDRWRQSRPLDGCGFPVQLNKKCFAPLIKMYRPQFIFGSGRTSPQINKENCKASDVRSETIKMQIFAALIRGERLAVTTIKFQWPPPRTRNPSRPPSTSFCSWYGSRYKRPIKMKHIHDFSDRKPEY